MAEQKIRGTDQIMPDSVTDVEVDGTVIVADGSHAYSANQPMGGNRVTGAGDPVDPQDYATLASMTDAIGTATDTVVWSPLTNGDATSPELVFDSFGDVIMVKKVY